MVRTGTGSSSSWPSPGRGSEGTAEYSPSGVRVTTMARLRLPMPSTPCISRQIRQVTRPTMIGTTMTAIRKNHSTSLSETWKKLASTSVELAAKSGEQQRQHGRPRGGPLGPVAGPVQKVVQHVVLV